MQYDPESLQKAVHAAENQLLVHTCKAAKQFHVPKSTTSIGDRVSVKLMLNPVHGDQPALPSEL